jgi:CRISPR/Cas system type I-B associated protein Csh2 (Cas7 group RAMP superfamily)
MIPITQTELDELCVESQYALTVLVDDFIDMYQRSDIFLKRRASQLLDLNCLMRSIQNYNLARWTDLTQDDIEKIKERIVCNSEWRD